MTRHRWLVVVLAVVVLGGATLFVARRGPARVTVDVGAVTRQARFRSTVTASGEIVATRYADIGSSVMGKIVSLPVAEGDRVKAGQMLARIDPVQAQSDASGAAAQVRALEAEERGAAEQVRGAVVRPGGRRSARPRRGAAADARKRELLQQALIPASDFESARAAAEAAHAQVTSARAAIDRARQTADAAARRVAQARAQQTSANDMLSKTSIVVADRRHRQPPARARRRDGRRRHPESARHDADDHLRSRRDQRGGEGRRSRRAARSSSARRRWSRSRRCPANSFPARSSRSARARCR